MKECFRCGKSGATRTRTIENSNFVENEEDYRTEKDMDFEVDFSLGDEEMRVRSVSLCDVCYSDCS